MVGDPRWVWGEPGPNDGDWAWIQHCLFHLADGGRATLVLPNGVLYRQGRPGRIRQRIIKAGLLDAVIALPPGLFHSTSIPTSLLVFAKGRRTANGEPAPTLMLDTRNSPLGREGRSTSLPDDLISEVSRIYHEWTAGQTPKSELASVAYFDDLAANDFIIDPARYVMVPRLARDADEVAAERSALLRKLENLNRVSRDADSRLQMILKGLR